MGDAARETADRVLLLPLADLRFELSSFGDGLVDGDRVERRPVVIADDGYSDTHRSCHSTRRDDLRLELERPGLAALNRLEDVRIAARQRVGELEK